MRTPEEDAKVAVLVTQARHFAVEAWKLGIDPRVTIDAALGDAVTDGVARGSGQAHPDTENDHGHRTTLTTEANCYRVVEEPMPSVGEGFIYVSFEWAKPPQGLDQRAYAWVGHPRAFGR